MEVGLELGDAGGELSVLLEERGELVFVEALRKDFLALSLERLQPGSSLVLVILLLLIVLFLLFLFSQ